MYFPEDFSIPTFRGFEGEPLLVSRQYASQFEEQLTDACNNSYVPSVEQSSTNITSYLFGARVRFRSADKHLPILSMALKQGMMTETAGLLVI